MVYNLNMRGFQCVLISSVIVSSAGLRLPDCGSDGRVEVSESDTNVVITCDQLGIGDTVSWVIRTYPPPGTDIALGVCDPSGSCTPGPPAYPVSRPSPTVSTMTITSPSRVIGGYTVICGVARGSERDTCQLDIVYPASVASVSVQHTAGTWKATGSVTISKVYSSLGQYSCQWYRGTSQTSQPDLLSNRSYTPSAIQGDPDYRTGTCHFTADILPTPGTYYYRVVVHPGGTHSVSGPVRVATPSAPTVSCSPSPYVPENTDVSCTCNTQNVGQPEGRLTWFRGSIINSGNYGDRTLEMTPQNIARAGGDVQLRCDVDWATRITGQTHTAMVSYGPGQVTIPESSTFYTDSSGSIDLTLTCTASDVRPTTGLVYTWTGRCDHVTTRTCTFKPRPPGSSGGNDASAAITCRVINPSNNNVYKQGSFRLDLKYPPSSPPQIVSYTQGHVLYKGDSLNLTCTVTGGDPSVTSVTLTCPGHHDNGATSGQSSSLIISSLTATDHGINCRCSGQWACPSYYTLTDSRTLTVYYPPSEPVISRTDSLPFPYLEGDTVRLSCDLQTSRGHPTARLTWTSHGNGETTNPDGAPATLVMTSVGKIDNNRSITCRADNEWIQHKGQDFSSTFTLRVYYYPIIRMTSQEGNMCHMIQNTAQCVVTQGQRVHFTCSADSNPPPETIVWRRDNIQDSNLDIGTDPDLDIQSADHKKHNGEYSCNVTTGSLEGTGRKPLTKTDRLTVLVKFIPERTKLTLRDVTGNLTVSEGDAVVLACLADGRPTPNMTLVKKETGSEVHSIGGGDLVLEDRDSWLNYTVTSAHCTGTGTYTCTAGNDVGTALSDSGAIFVNCTPRYAGPPPVDVPSVNYINQSVRLTFNLWALPVPDSYHILFLGQFGNETTTTITSIDFGVQFRVAGELFNVTCDVTVVKMTAASAAGFYNLTVSNTLGETQLAFQVKYNEMPPHVPPQQNGVAYGAIGGGIAAVIVVAVIIGAVVFIRKRRLRTPALQTPPGTAQQNASLHVTGNESTDQPSVHEGLRQEDVGQRSAYATWQLSGNTTGASVQTSDYEHLRMGDVGQRSPYSTFQPQHQSDRTPDHVYENSPDDSTRTYVNTVSLN